MSLPKRLREWLAAGRRIGAKLLGSCNVGIIFFDQDNPKNAVEFRGEVGGNIEQQVVTVREEQQPVTLTATDLSAAKPEPLPRVEVQPAVNLPEIEPHILDQQQAEILEAIETERGRLQASEIALAVGRKNDAAIRRKLSAMRHKLRLLDWSAGEGYGLTLRGRLSLTAWRDNTFFPG